MKTLYVISSAAPPARRAAVGIRAAQARGWTVCLILTPAAHRWATEDTADGPGEISLDQLAELTGHMVRHQYKLPSQRDVLPPADALLAAPATLNTMTKWADGHADTLALGLLTEALGKTSLPIVALPYINNAQARHPALGRAVSTLRNAGVRVLLDDGQGHGEGFTPHPPGHGNVEAYPWDLALDNLPPTD